MCLVPRYIMLHHYHMTWCHEVIICGIKIGTCYQSQFGSFDSGILRDVFSGLRAESSGCANRTRLWIVSSHTWQSRFKSTFDLERQRIPRLSTIFPQSFLLAKTACCLTQGATIRIESGKDMLCLEPTYGSCRIAFDFGHRVQTKAQEHWQHRSVAHTLHTLSLSFSLVLGASKLDVMHTWLSRTQVWACVSHISFFFARFQLSAERPSEKPRKARDSRGLHSCYERNPTHKQKHGNIIKLNDKKNFSLLRSIPIVQQYLYATLQSFDHITKSLQLQKVQKASEGMT